MLGRGTVSLLAIASHLTAVVVGQAYDYGFDVAKVVRRQTQAPFVVGGLGRRVNGSLPVRPELREMQQDQDKWTLYTLGLSMMQYTEQSQPLSWYQIAGANSPPHPFSCFFPAGRDELGLLTNLQASMGSRGSRGEELRQSRAVRTLDTARMIRCCSCRGTGRIWPSTR